MSDSNAKSIKDKVQTVIFLCFLIIFPIFALAFSLYSQTSLKLLEVLDRSFSVSIGFFGGAATLTAAYIASLLFNDWRTQEVFVRSKNLHDEAVSVLLKTTKKLNSISGLFEANKHQFQDKELTDSQKNDLLLDFTKHLKEVIIEVQDLTHDIGVKFALDYLKSIKNNDEDLNFAFYTLMDIKIFIQNLVKNTELDKSAVTNILEFIHNLNLKIDHKLQERNK